PHDVEHGQHRAVEIAHHPRVAEPDHDEPAAHQLAVSIPIALEGLSAPVPLEAVRLDHETVSDEEVDPTDARDRHLAPCTDAVASQREAHQRLDPGLGCGVMECEYPATTRRGVEEGAK